MSRMKNRAIDLANQRNVVLRGDCVEVMKTLPANSIDAIVTDPPYGIDFMGKDWDGFGTPKGFQTWTEQWAREAFRVLKPGGHLLAFGGTRMFHRLATGIEDAGFEVRDMMAWLYGSGFPKSLDVSKAIDKKAGAEREVVGHSSAGASNGSVVGLGSPAVMAKDFDITAPATDDAKRWAGWGTALKPAQEPIVLARKPLIGTVAENVLAHGTGAINIKASRLEGERWPANILFDEEAAAELDAQASNVSRFFYVAKPGKKERNAGAVTNIHPTVKPIALMGYLIKLVTPLGGVVLDPFLGSGSTACAAALNGFDWLGIEREESYADIAEARIAHYSEEKIVDPILWDDTTSGDKTTS